MRSSQRSEKRAGGCGLPTAVLARSVIELPLMPYVLYGGDATEESGLQAVRGQNILCVLKFRV